MRPVLLLLSILMVALGMNTARAQDAAAFIVTYIEVAPSEKSKAAKLLRELRDASRKEEGSARFEILQRMDRQHHFAILEAWKDQKAQEAHAAAGHTKNFRNKLQPLQIAAYDERPHTALAVAPIERDAKTGRGAIYAVTHVDFIPPKKDEGIAALTALVEPSRKESGNLRFDVLQQTSRPNHETVVEVWKNQRTLEAHAVSAHLKGFRDQLLPMSGSLYDERLYKALN